MDIDNSWGANTNLQLISTAGGGGFLFFRGGSGENIGVCGFAGGGASIADGPMPWGHFNR